jgi:hypothetical protein
MFDIKIKPVSSDRFTIMYKFDDSELTVLAKLKIPDISGAYSQSTIKCDIDEADNTFFIQFYVLEYCINEMIDCISCIKGFDLIIHNGDHVDLSKRYFEIKEFISIKYSLGYKNQEIMTLNVSGKYKTKF